MCTTQWIPLPLVACLRPFEEREQKEEIQNRKQKKWKKNSIEVSTRILGNGIRINLITIMTYTDIRIFNFAIIQRGKNTLFTKFFRSRVLLYLLYSLPWLVEVYLVLLIKLILHGEDFSSFSCLFSLLIH